jgi:hypothetical protein
VVHIPVDEYLAAFDVKRPTIFCVAPSHGAAVPTPLNPKLKAGVGMVAMMNSPMPDVPIAKRQLFMVSSLNIGFMGFTTIHHGLQQFYPSALHFPNDRVGGLRALKFDVGGSITPNSTHSLHPDGLGLETWALRR